MSEFTVRGASAGDAPQIHEVVVVAFADHPEVADLWAEVERRGHARGSLVAVAVAVEADAEAGSGSGEIVGHVGLSHAWVDARRELVDVWILSPLSTRPDRQRQGIGSALIRAAIGAARSGGVPALFLEGSPAFYGPRGFESASARGFLPASTRTPDLAFQVVTLEAFEDWMTGALVYRDVWWEYDAAGLRDPDLAELEGFLGKGRTHVR